jgi:hypothetical protein
VYMRESTMMAVVDGEGTRTGTGRWEEERKEVNVCGRQQTGKNDARSLLPSVVVGRRGDVLLPSPHLTLILLHSPHKSGAGGAAFQAPPNNWPCHPAHKSWHSRPRLALSFPFPPSVPGRDKQQQRRRAALRRVNEACGAPEDS